MSFRESSPPRLWEYLTSSVQFGELEQPSACRAQKLEQWVNYLSVLDTDKLVLTMTRMTGAQILHPEDTKTNEMILTK